jgi:uncharacterized protein
MKDYASIIQQTEAFIKKTLESEETGHDWWHVYRVWTMAKRIAKEEDGVNLFVIEIAALLHDLGDYKLSMNKEETAEQDIAEYLEQFSLPDDIVKRIIDTVDRVSFSKNVHRTDPFSIEAQIVQDADRLDALGAIGIARTFAFGGSKKRLLHDPNTKPKDYKTTEERRAGTNSTINHFYEKLLLLKDRMNTKTGKNIAEERHEFMEQFLKEFYNEWEGKSYEPQ